MYLILLICSIWASSALADFRQNLTAPDISGNSSSPDLVIDLGYEQYQGISDSSSGLSIWLGYAFVASYSASKVAHNILQNPIRSSTD